MGQRFEMSRENQDSVDFARLQSRKKTVENNIVLFENRVMELQNHDHAITPMGLEAKSAVIRELLQAIAELRVERSQLDMAIDSHITAKYSYLPGTPRKNFNP